MTRIALKSGSMLSIHGMQMVFDRELCDQSLVFTRMPTGIPWLVGEDQQSRLPNWSDVEAALAVGEFKILGKAELLPVVQKPHAAVEDTISLDPRSIIRAIYVREFDKSPVGLGKRSLETLIERIAASNDASQFDWIPSASSLRRWVQTRGTIGSRRTIDMVAMIGRTCKTYRFPPTVNRALQACVCWYWTLESRSFGDSYARLSRMIGTINHIRLARGLFGFKRPSDETLRRYIRAAECKETWISKYGARAAHIRWGPVGAGLTASTILEVAILDHTVFDDILVMDVSRRLPMGRPALVITIDVFSRCILAWNLSFEPPQIWSVAKSIRMANRPKPWLAERFPEASSGASIYGKMAELVVDNAWENVGCSLKDGLQDLGISLTFAPIATPEYKAIGERFFKTLNTILVHKLPGAVDIDIETRRLLHIDPQKDAILALEEVEALIEEAVNLYHHTRHETLNAQPALAWKKAATHGVQVLNDDSLLTATLGIVRTGNLDRRGLKFHHIWYRDPAVISTILDNNFHKVAVRDRRKKSARVQVKFKYDSGDLGSIEVFDASSGCYLKMRAVDQAYASGLSHYQHSLVLEIMRREAEEFFGEEQWLAALQRLRTHVEAAAPGLRARARKAAMRLKKRSAEPEIQGDTLAVGLHTESPVRQFLIPNRAMAADRTDGGAIAESALTRKARKRTRKRTASERNKEAPSASKDAATFQIESDFLATLEW